MCLINQLNSLLFGDAYRLAVILFLNWPRLTPDTMNEIVELEMNPDVLENVDFPQVYPRMIQLDSLNLKLKAQLSEADEKFSHLEMKYRSACEARDDLKFQVDHKEREISRLKQKNEKLKEEVIHVKEAKSARERILEALVNISENQHQKTKEGNQMNELGEDTGEIVESETQPTQLKELQGKIESLEEQLTMYKNQLQTKELNIAQLEREKSEVESISSKEINECKEKLQTKELNIAQLEREKSEVETVLQKEINECTEKLQTKELNIAQLEREKSEVETVLRKEINDCKEKLQEEKDRNNSLVEELKIMKVSSRLKSDNENVQLVRLEEDIQDSILRKCTEWKEIKTIQQKALCDVERIMSSIEEKVLISQNTKCERNKDVHQDSSSRNLERPARNKKQVMPLRGKENQSVEVPSQKKMTGRKKNKEDVSEITSEKEVLQSTSKISSRKEVKRKNMVKQCVLSTPEKKNPELPSSTSIEETTTTTTTTTTRKPKDQEKPRELRSRRRKCE